MDIKEIKNLLKNSAAVLVAEDNEPSFVIIDYKAYKSLTADSDQKIVEPRYEQEVKVRNISEISEDTEKQAARGGELEALERINKEILVLIDEIEKEEKSLYPTSIID